MCQIQFDVMQFETFDNKTKASDAHASIVFLPPCSYTFVCCWVWLKLHIECTGCESTSPLTVSILTLFRFNVSHVHSCLLWTHLSLCVKAYFWIWHLVDGQCWRKNPYEKNSGSSDKFFFQVLRFNFIKFCGNWDRFVGRKYLNYWW